MRLTTTPDDYDIENSSATTKSQAEAASLILRLSKRHFMPGCGFGINQPVLLGSMSVSLPHEFDLRGVKKAMNEFILSPSDDTTFGNDAESNLVIQVQQWQTTIQQEAKVPVFGQCRLITGNNNILAGGARQIEFAVPSHAPLASCAAIQFVCEAICRLAPNASNAEIALPAIRIRFNQLLDTLKQHAESGSNMIHFIRAAQSAGIERHKVMDSTWAFGLGINRQYFTSSITSDTPSIGVWIARNKLRCGRLLATAGLPVAKKALATGVEHAIRLANEIGYPVVIKPVDSDQGRGVTAGIVSESDLRKAFRSATRVSKNVMIEKHHDGRDYRVTVLHGKAIKVMDRRPGGVTGDGHRTVTELVNARRQEDLSDKAYARKGRPPLLMDEEAKFQLGAQGLEPSSVVPEGQFVPLRRRANISTGGSYEILDPNEIHPDNRKLAENAAITLGLDIAGVDIISGDPKESWRDTGGIVCEVNSQPQIGYRKGERIFEDILTTVIGGNGHIPVHLIVVRDGIKLPNPLPELADSLCCNAAAWDNTGWIDGAGTFGPFPNVHKAAKGILLDKRVKAALIAMSENQILQYGLPLAQLDSIHLAGWPDWKPQPTLRRLIARHSQKQEWIKHQASDQRDSR